MVVVVPGFPIRHNLQYRRQKSHYRNYSIISFNVSMLWALSSVVEHLVYTETGKKTALAPCGLWWTFQGNLEISAREKGPTGSGNTLKFFHEYRSELEGGSASTSWLNTSKIRQSFFALRSDRAKSAESAQTKAWAAWRSSSIRTASGFSALRLVR